MSFVHPGYLWFLSLLAIPIILHLFHFRRFKRIYFPSLKYLKEQEQEKKSVKKLKRLLILFARILAFTCIIIAFAQPFFDQAENTTSGIPITAIYIDNSLSMSAKGTEGELLSEAREIAKKIITKSAGNTRFFITTNEFSGIERKLHAKATAVEVIDNIVLNKTPRPLDQVVEWQNEYLNRYHREVARISKVNRVLLSDFQKSTGNLSTYKQGKTVWREQSFLIQCLPQKTDNIYVDSIWMDNPVHKPGQSCKVNFRIKNVGDQEATNIPITVLFDGKTRMTNISVNPKSSATSYMFFTPTSPGYIEGKISVADQNITFDDDFYFTNEISKAGNIVIINGLNSEQSTEKVFLTEPFYSVQTCDEFSFNKRILTEADLLILNGINELPSGLIADVSSFMAQGGSVFCIPGDNIQQTDYTQLLKTVGLSGYTGKVTTGNQLSEISYSSNFFDGMFDKQQTSLNLPLLKSVYALRNYRQANAEVLLKLRNQLPLLLAIKQKGIFYLLNTDLSKTNGGFTANALFPSLLLRSAELSLRSLPLYFTIGSAGVLEIQSNSNQEEPLSLQSKNNSFIPRQMNMDGLIRLQLNQPELNERISEGFYTLKSREDLGQVAFNLNRSESQTVLLNIDDLENQFKNAGFTGVKAQTMNTGNSAFQLNTEKPNSFWRTFVLLAMLCLLVEMALLKFWK
ncbi:MAG: BatA domain-containing protein [Flavobacteriales bacterium]